MRHYHDFFGAGSGDATDGRPQERGEKMSKFGVVQTIHSLDEMLKGLILAVAVIMAALIGLGVGLGLTFS